MSMTINPDHNKPKKETSNKKVFGVSTGKSFTQDDTRVGVYTDAGTGLLDRVERLSIGKWYNGPRELLTVLESYVTAISGDRQYGNAGTGASFGFLGHLARRLPLPILFDDPEIAQFIFGNNKPTAAVDTSGRMWMYAGFFEECLNEEARDKTMVLPLMIHEYLHIALNHTKRMHNFPADISNVAKDKVINPMGIKMFDAKKVRFSDIFALAHGNCPEDAKYNDKSEETVGKMLMIERREQLENKGTIRIKKLIIVDGPVTTITTLTAGKNEIKEYDTVTVTVQDMGMMDKTDTEFDCATLEVDETDNRLAVRRRPGGGGEDSEDQPDSPIEIPTESDSPSGQGKGKGKGKPPANPDSAEGNKADADKDPDKGNSDNDAGRQSLDDIKKQMSGKGSDQGSGNDAGDPQSGDTPSGNGGPGDPFKPSDDPANASDAKGSKGKADPRKGDDAPGASDEASGGFKGAPGDYLGNQIRGNPLDSDGGHEINLDKLNDWLKNNGYEALLKKMRTEDFEDATVERAIEISLVQAERERLIIGSGYAGGHVEDYMHTVVRPSSIYKVNVLRRAIDFLQGSGCDITTSLDEYGIYTYISPEDLGMGAEDGIYYPGAVLQKPEGIFGVIIDTSGSIWSDKKRLGHLASFALGLTGSRDDTSPDTLIVGADTVVSGKPTFYDAEQIIDAIDSGIALGGGGGTCYTQPINQFMAHCKEEDIKVLGILYLGDFEVSPPLREHLPDDLPPMYFLGMPHDVVRAADFVKSVESWAEVGTIEEDITLDYLKAQAKADANRGIGHNNLQ